MFENIPNVKLGLIAVSRDCFPRTLSEKRRANIVKASTPTSSSPATMCASLPSMTA